jgi:maltodextrin utilization protein YvdJ
MPKSYTPIANKVCDKSIGFHFANGKIHDTNGHLEKKSTAWRVVRDQAKDGSLGVIGI